MKKKNLQLIILLMVLSVAFVQAQQSIERKLPVKLEELTVGDFVLAAEKSGGVCLIPLGVMEKHGPHLPLGTDLIVVRELALRAAAKEYALVFPEYYFGQINEARHQPGTISYSHELLWIMLQETLNELSRNGFRKIILVNGHGGNNAFLNYFLFSQLESPKDYSVILFSPTEDPAFRQKQETYFESFAPRGHAGELETSMVLATRPDLVQLERAKLEPGQDLDKLGGLKNQTSGFWWYASFPDHYHGDGSFGKKELGDLTLDYRADLLAALIRDFKSSQVLEEIQKEFFERVKKLE